MPEKKLSQKLLFSRRQMQYDTTYPELVKLNSSYKPVTKKILACCCMLLLMFTGSKLKAQQTVDIYAKDTKEANRAKLYKNIVSHGISKNLSYPLSDSTEENWMDAFWAMEFIRYKAPWAENLIATALQNASNRSIPFQRSLLELLYANYPLAYSTGVEAMLDSTNNDKIFAMCAEYLLVAKPAVTTKLIAKTSVLLKTNPSSAILSQLAYKLSKVNQPISLPNLNDIIRQPFFDSAVVVYSFQRKNRDYPGMAVVRDSAGNFLRTADGKLFAVPQLARSITNLPGYLTNGNTPQGIFRMFGTAVSTSNFIGPTPNIQLTMSCETSLRHFMNDSSITDTTWTESWYKRLLPLSWQNYYPIFQSYYAGKAGRTEIIAHGTTIDPAYYQGMPYYPQTPSLGCLCARESWDAADGKRIGSDQQQLVDAVIAAGGADGYVIVIELNDEQRPVLLSDLAALIK